MTADAAFRDAVIRMPQEYLECRGSQHLMETTERFRVVDSERETDARPHGGHRVYARRQMTCARCGMVRRDFYAITSRSGSTMLVKINSSYDPPEGYSVHGLGNVQGNRGLVLGIEFDQAINRTRLRGRGRPRKAVS